MMNKFFKKCLFTVLSLGLATSVYAADLTPTVSGEVDAYITSSDSTIGMASYGEITVGVAGTAGSWSISASQTMALDPTATNPTIDEQVVTLEDDAMAISFGYYTPYGITMGGAYVVGSIDDMFVVGETAPTDSATYNAVFTLKDLGLSAALYMMGDDTVFGAIYSTTISDIELAVEFASGTVSTVSYSDIAVAAQYSLSDSMAIALNIDSSDADPITVLWFDMGLDETSGVSVGYGSQGSASSMEVTYSKAFDALSVYATYFDDGTTSTIGGGMYMAF